MKLIDIKRRELLFSIVSAGSSVGGIVGSALGAAPVAGVWTILAFKLGPKQEALVHAITARVGMSMRNCVSGRHWRFFMQPVAGSLTHHPIYLGITTHRPEQYEEMQDVMRRHPLDFIQLNYSLADRAAEKDILPLALDRGIAVLVNLPFARGRLFKAVANLALPDWAADMDAGSWGQIFLKYVISHPAETLPIPGTTKPQHAKDNMGAATGRLPDAGLRREIERFIAPRL